MQPTRGEVWLFDLGMAAKTRPVLVVSVAYGDTDRAIVTVVPHTTQLRGSPFEISVRAPFLQQGAWFKAYRHTRKPGRFARSAYSRKTKWRRLWRACGIGWGSRRIDG